MHYKRNSALWAAVLVALFLFYTLPVMAQGAIHIPPAGVQPPTDSVTDSGAPPVAQPDTAASWDELAAWMKAHQNSGGSVRLTAPIVYEESYVSYLFMSPTTLDLGEYSLTVKGKLELYSPYLTIKAKGGPDASLRVSSGGILNLTAHTVEAETDAPALWQEEGGLLLTDIVAGDAAVHYAVQPVARVRKSIVVAVQRGESAYEALPDTVAAEVVFQGSRMDKQMSVVWNTSDEDTINGIADQQRTKVSGYFDKALTYGPLDCTLVFLNQPLTFTDATAERNRQWVMIWADFTIPSFPIEVEAEYSFDLEHWLAAQAEIDQSNNYAELCMLFSHPSVAEEDEVIWDTAEHSTLYLRLHWLGAENDDDAYSDILAVDGDTMGIASNPGGNRGGGTGLGQPELPPLDNSDGSGSEGAPEEPEQPLPPAAEPPNEGAPEEPEQPLPPAAEPPNEGATDEPEQPLPPAAKPPNEGATDEPDKPQPPVVKPPKDGNSSDISRPIGGMSGGQEQSPPPAETTEDLLSPTQVEATGIVSKMKAPASTATKATAFRPEVSENIFRKELLEAIPKKNSEREIARSQETLTAYNPELQAVAGGNTSGVVEASSYPARSAVHVAVGIFATGGIIALTMTWRSWSKSFYRIRCFLRAKK